MDGQGISEELFLEPKKRMKNVISTATSPIICPSVPINRYYRSLSELYRMACVHLSEKQPELALILYVRFSSMLIEELPKHPDYTTFTSLERDKVFGKLKLAIETAETIKAKLKLKFERDANAYQDQKERRLAQIEANKIRQLDQNISLPPNDSLDFANIPTIDTHKISFPSLELKETASMYARKVGNGKNGHSKYLPFTKNSFNLRPSIDRSTKPTEILHNSDQCKFVTVASNIVCDFLKCASKNTSQSVETCAILCGKLTQNLLVVTHAVIPKQNGGPDSCDMVKEEEVFEFQDAHELITIGWIHTHPTQDAFLSSVDLHTHCSYQLLMSEAIAIVCAPKFNKTDIFRLTSDGLHLVSSCRQQGFHPHRQSPPLFESCSHASISSELTGYVIDLR